MLNYDAMKRLNLKPYAALLVLAAFLSACSGTAENAGSSNTNAPPQPANTNSAAQPQVAQGNPPAAAPSPAPLTVQPIPPPPSPVAKSAAAGNANAANAANASNASAAANARSPKLVAPDKKINFGKQPQDKSLVRAIAIKNGGRANLNIESVVPS